MRRLRYYAPLVAVFVLVIATLACGSSDREEVPTAAPPPTQAPTSEPPPLEPTPEPSPIQEPSPTEEPDPEPEELSTSSTDLDVVMVNAYQDDVDYWYVVGLVTNHTERAVDSVEVEVEILDASEETLYSEITSTSLYSLAPGETSPFTVWTGEELPDADSVIATIVGRSAAEIDRVDVEVRGVVMTMDDDGDVHVTGELVNNTDQSVVINNVAAATFDASGEIQTGDYSSVSIGHLDAGESGPFRVMMTGPGSGLEDGTYHETYVDAEIASPSDPFSIGFSDFYSYVDAYGWFHLVGEVSNDSDQTLSISLVASIFDADGNVIDAASLSVPVHVAPGETVPCDLDTWGPLNYTEGFVDHSDSYVVQWDPYWTWDADSEYIDLPTTGDDNVFDEYQGTFTGQVLNDSGGPIGYTTVIVSLRDAGTGELIATDYTTIWDEIPDGESAEYEVYVDIESELDVDSIEYFLMVKGERP